ncbi:hypothetical protein C8Q79DRAFT_117857 [Trametes meyenii]|nr:hypothetical protein C8Q79DRAFT_117857 [Trametes meyenii]
MKDTCKASSRQPDLCEWSLSGPCISACTSPSCYEFIGTYAGPPGLPQAPSMHPKPPIGGSVHPGTPHSVHPLSDSGTRPPSETSNARESAALNAERARFQEPFHASSRLKTIQETHLLSVRSRLCRLTQSTDPWLPFERVQKLSCMCARRGAKLS